MEAVTVNVHNPVKKFKVYAVIEECLNVLTMVTNHKHSHEKLFTPLNTVSKWYPNIWGRCTKVLAHERPWSTVKCERPIRLCTVKNIEIRPQY